MTPLASLPSACANCKDSPPSSITRSFGLYPAETICLRRAIAPGGEMTTSSVSAPAAFAACSEEMNCVCVGGTAVSYTTCQPCFLAHAGHSTVPMTFSFLPFEWMIATLPLVFAFSPTSSAVLNGVSVRSSELKKRSHAQVQCAVAAKVLVAAQGVT